MVKWSADHSTSIEALGYYEWTNTIGYDVTNCSVISNKKLRHLGVFTIDISIVNILYLIAGLVDGAQSARQYT